MIPGPIVFALYMLPLGSINRRHRKNKQTGKRKAVRKIDFTLFQITYNATPSFVFSQIKYTSKLHGFMSVFRFGYQ